jgi:hypothetical protein
VDNNGVGWAVKSKYMPRLGINLKHFKKNINFKPEKEISIKIKVLGLFSRFSPTSNYTMFFVENSS